jgi:hypothetical protein
MSEEFEYNLRTAIGLLLIATGVAGCLYFGWWLIFRGDVIEAIHILKMSLPGWAWVLLKFGLSGLFALLFLSLFVIFAVMVFAGGRRRGRKKEPASPNQG